MSFMVILKLINLPLLFDRLGRGTCWKASSRVSRYGYLYYNESAGQWLYRPLEFARQLEAVVPFFGYDNARQTANCRGHAFFTRISYS